MANEKAVISLKKISGEDADNLEVDKIFRWVIGYEYEPTGERTTVSRIVFRDLPRITEEDMDEARKWAYKLFASFGR